MSDDPSVRPCSLSEYIKAHPELSKFKAEKAWEKWVNSYRKYQLEQK